MRRTGHMTVALLLACAACKASTATTKAGASKTRPGSTAGASSAGEGQGAATSGSNAQAGSDAGRPPTGTTDAGTSPSTPGGTMHDGGNTAASDAGTTMVTTPIDASAGDAATSDALVGMLGTGSCCQEQTTPGCGNADLQVCVCEKLPACCTSAWSKPCVLIVKEKYCQPGVRDCVCGTNPDAGQWGQTMCCDTAWTDNCNTVAEIKCSAVVGCF
jgi:hypothetical protein